MSETLSYPIEIDYQIEMSEYLANESIAAISEFPRLDGELFPLVYANTDAIVPCPWMGSEEVSLNVAMNNYPVIMSEANVDQIIADVNSMLANRVMETEEQEPEEQPLENKDIEKKEDEDSQEKPVLERKIELKVELKTESRTIDNKNQVAPTDTRPTTSVEDLRVAEKPVPTILNAPQLENVQAVSFDKKIAGAEFRSELKQPGDNAVEMAVNAQKTTPGKSINDSLTLAETTSDLVQERGHVEAVAEDLAQDSYAADTDPDLISRLPKPITGMADDTTGLESEIKDLLSVEPHQAELEIVSQDHEQPSDSPAQQILEEDAKASDLTDEAVAGIEHDQLDFAEEELVQLRNIENMHQDEVEPSLFSDQTMLKIADPELGQGEGGQILLPRLEKFVIAAPPLKHLESTLIELVNGVEAGELKENGDIDAALSEIITISEKLEVDDYENIPTDAQKQVAGLFVKVFNELGIEHNPELIESLVYMTIAGQLDGKVGIILEEDEATETPHDKARQKILRKLVSVFSYIRKAIINASAIGKSAITLYSFRAAA